jgi:hypothetical protein
MSPGPAPTHDLAAVQAACRGGGLVLMGSVVTTASSICHDPNDIIECICALEPRDFWKTMPSEKRVGRYQDVYKTRSHGFAVYVKFDYDGDAQRVFLVSFKRDEDA